MSVVEALRHSGFQHGCAIEIDWVDSETLDDGEVRARARARRRHPDPRRLRRPRHRGQDRGGADRPRAEDPVPRRLPRHADGGRRLRAPRGRTWTGANSTEFDPETPYPVIDLLPEQKEVADMGGTMRLGADPVKLHEGTRAREIYGEAVIYERHRHRYEVNNFLRSGSRPPGLVISGTSPDERLVEIIEIPDHPFFVASQFHPEFKSRPERPAPLFRDFVGAALERARERAPGGGRRRGRGEPRRAAASAVARRRSQPRRVRPASEAEKARLNETFADALPDREPVRAASARAPTRVAARAARRWARGRRTAAAGRAARQPARAHRRPRRALDPALRAPRHGRRRRRPIEPVLVDGGWENANDGILGADNKAAVAVILELARRCSVEGSPVGLELLFTAGEENALRGRQGVRRLAAAVRLRLRLRPRDADRRGRHRVADLLPPRRRVPRPGRPRRHPARGRAARAILAAAHADRRTCRSAASTSRRPPTSARSTAASGRTNVVAERCRLLAEARSLDPEPGRGRASPAIVDALHDGAAHARVRRRRRLRAACSSATGRSRARPRSSPPRRRCAPAATSRKRIVTGGGVGRERARGRRLPVREPRQRHRAQPRADRAGRGRRARGRCSTSRFALLDEAAAV